LWNPAIKKIIVSRNVRFFEGLNIEYRKYPTNTGEETTMLLPSGTYTDKNTPAWLLAQMPALLEDEDDEITYKSVKMSVPDNTHPAPPAQPAPDSNHPLDISAINPESPQAQPTPPPSPSLSNLSTQIPSLESSGEDLVDNRPRNPQSPAITTQSSSSTLASSAPNPTPSALAPPISTPTALFPPTPTPATKVPPPASYDKLVCIHAGPKSTSAPPQPPEVIAKIKKDPKISCSGRVTGRKKENATLANSLLWKLSEQVRLNGGSNSLEIDKIDADKIISWSIDSELDLVAKVYTEPTTLEQARSSKDSSKWNSAMHHELDMLRKNSTYELVPLPAGCKAIGVKWIFKVKLNPDGSINKYKARLVAKGFRQKDGIDYYQTYTPVAKMASIRTILAVAAANNLRVDQLDMESVYLNREMDTEVYIEQPPGFVDKKHPNYVYRLWKALYGLKQAENC
jgi:hypothetical protein